jgi:methionine synthase I (cobalamin-dependent)
MSNLEAIPFRSVNGSRKSVIRRNAIKVITRTILPVRLRMKKVQNSVTEFQATIPLTNAGDQTLVETATEIANAKMAMETDVTRIVQDPDRKKPAIRMVHREKNKTRMKSGISEETTNRIAASVAVVEPAVKR